MGQTIASVHNSKQVEFSFDLKIYPETHYMYNIILTHEVFVIIGGAAADNKSTEVRNPWRNKCSAVVEKYCLRAEYRIRYRIGPRTIIMLIIIRILCGFRAALDLDAYPLSNLIRPRCAERAKPGRAKAVLIMHIGFFTCFHAISLECRRFSKMPTLFFMLL